MRRKEDFVGLDVRCRGHHGNCILTDYFVSLLLIISLSAYVLLSVSLRRDSLGLRGVEVSGHFGVSRVNRGFLGSRVRGGSMVSNCAYAIRGGRHARCGPNGR